MTFSAAHVFDPGPVDAQNLSYRWSVTRVGTERMEAGNSPSLVFTPPDQGVYWIELSLSDGLDTTTQRRRLEVRNADPVLELDPVKSNLPFNAPVRFRGSVASGIHDLRVIARDAAGNVGRTERFSLVVALHEPTGIVLDAEVIYEDDQVQATDRLFGTLRTSDLDNFDRFAYELVGGLGSQDNDRFRIVNDQVFLRAGELLDYQTQSEYLVRVRSTDLAGNSVEEVLTMQIAPRDAIPPLVSRVIASSSNWTSSFIDAVDGGGLNAGNGLGMTLASGGPSIKQASINRLFLQFSEAVTNISPSTFELRDSFGVLPITVAYDPATFIATVSTNAPLGVGKYRLTISDSVADTSGNLLDGDSSGAAGGIFNFRFNVMPADANGDDRTNGSDLAFFASAFNARVGQANYNVNADWNGDGRVNGQDLAIFSANFNRRLGNLSEPAAPFGGGQGGGAQGGGFGRFGSSANDLYFAGYKQNEDDDDE